MSSGYDYDDLGRFASVTWSGVDNVYTATYAYVVNSDLIAGYDVNVGTNVYKTRKTFEPNRNLMSAVSNLWNAAEVSTYAYGNDAIGRRTNRIDSGTSSATNTFGYNIRSELKAAEMGTNDYGYAYDPIGNRLTATNNTEIWTYLANELNQYTNVADGVTNSPTYDLDGNMLTYNGWTFTWNGENRLVSASNAATVVTFAYDHMGRRFMKTSGGVTNRYTYDGWAMIREASTAATNDYVYGLDLSGSMQGAGTIGGLLAATLGGTTSVSSVFYAYDANGNVTELVNTNGTTAAKYQYDPFGNTILANDTDSSGTVSKNPFRFSTKYTDDETGLVYYGYRYYAPTLGRWLSRDPINDLSFEILSWLDTHGYDIGATLLNSYLFADNSASLYYDYMGLALPKQCNDAPGCKCTCGPEAMDALQNTVFDMRRRFRLLNPIQRIRACTPLRMQAGADIDWNRVYRLFPEECGQGECCKESIMLSGECHWVWEVNYVVVGTMSRLCYYPRAAMHALIFGNKNVMKPWFCNQPDGPDEYTERVKGWADLAYDIPIDIVFGHDYFSPHPSGHPGMSHCEDCNKSMGKTIWPTNWPP